MKMFSRFLQRLFAGWHAAQSNACHELLPAKECMKLFPARLEGKVSREKWIAFWEKRADLENNYDLVYVPDDFLIPDGDEAMSLYADSEKIATYLWIRKGQTLEEALKQRGYVFPENRQEESAQSLEERKMQVALNAKQIEIVQQLIGDEGLRKCVYTCEECVHYCPHYVPQAPMNIAPYKKLNIGHCAKKLLLIKKNEGACARFELKELGNE